MKVRRATEFELGKFAEGTSPNGGFVLEDKDVIKGFVAYKSDIKVLYAYNFYVTGAPMRGTSMLVQALKKFAKRAGYHEVLADVGYNDTGLLRLTKSGKAVIRTMRLAIPV